MTPSRLAIGAAAALFSALLSIDPSVAAGDAAPPFAIDAPVAEPAAAEAVIAAAPAIVPSDVTLEITSEGSRSQRVVVHRPGYLVALLHGAARSAGKDWAALRVQIAEPSGKHRDARPGVEIDRLVWESTRLGTFVTERGLVSLSHDGSSLAGQLALAAPPEPAGEAKTAHAICVAHRDGAGGFTALCRVDHAARRITAANVTGLRVIEGAVVAAEPRLDPLVRLDLPLAPGSAEARIVGFTLGRVGHALRVEASWAPGEAPALFFAETERVQPQAP
ncbi:MAG: hypothetical protein ABJE95_26815 [Byssovorax sp.]